MIFPRFSPVFKKSFSPFDLILFDLLHFALFALRMRSPHFRLQLVYAGTMYVHGAYYTCADLTCICLFDDMYDALQLRCVLLRIT